MLYIVSLSGKRIGGFMRSAILAAHEAGVEFTMASNMSMADVEKYREDCKTYGIKTVHINFDRNPLSLKNISAYRQLTELMRKERFDFVHCNTPIGGVLGRICAHKAKIPYVIYQAHGFHFYKGAPLKNWILYYPVEKMLSRWTDVLVTINQEDYALAKKKMHAKQVKYIPGVGIDLKKFSSGILSAEEKEALRQSLGVEKCEKMLLSVGELIPRKDHETAIRAVAALRDKRVKLFICGQGELAQKLQSLIDSLGLTEQVKLLGFRNDVSSLCDCADLFVFPSLQEGLPVALMEAVASKLPVVCSDIRGNTDLVGEESLFRCGDVMGLAQKIRISLSAGHTAEVEKNYRNLQKFDLTAVVPDLANLYQLCDEGGVIHLREIYKRQQFRKSIGVPVNALLLTSVGELNKNKNHEIVIRALAELGDVSLHYAIAGKGELHDALENLANALGLADRVHLLGFRNDVNDLYHAADLYIHPSRREGLPVAVMEAIASKTPVICSNIRGSADLVGPNALFESDHVNALAEKIGMYLSKDNTAETEKNLQHLQKFDLAAVIPEIKDLYNTAQTTALL